jgi:hypothetical protein
VRGVAVTVEVKRNMSARSTYIFVVKCRYFVIVAAKRPTQCVTAMPTTAAATSFVMPGWKMADGKGPLLILEQ